LTATETIVGILEEIFTNTDCHAFDLALESLSDEFGFGTFTSKKFEQ
jgi:hypothetical protein